MFQPHLKIDKIEPYVLLPGDPGRIDKIIPLLTNVQEINFNREFRICNGEYKGIRLSLVSTGIGCPAAAITIEELSQIGAKIIIRIGTCGGLLPEMQSGDIIIPTAAVCADGTTREYNPSIVTIAADDKINQALKLNAQKTNVRFFLGVNRTHDAFYEPTSNFVKLAGQRLISSEMECSAVFLVSQLRNLKAGAILVVNTPEPPEEVMKNPEIIYRLADVEKVKNGMNQAIYIALETIRSLSLSDKNALD
ncbi:nucleoside phosphorylase [Candidatus Woesearchaeota archaeon]|nr:nucleoside phosphorylase [Candidatus Woesearchaeota archaeon]